MRVDLPAPLGPTARLEGQHNGRRDQSWWWEKRTDTDARRERDGDAGVVQLGLGRARVGEGAVGHLEDGTGARADAHERARRRERELDDLVREGVVSLARGVLLDELGEVAAVVDELLLVVVDDVGAHGVEEARVVRDDHRRDARLRLEVCAGRGMQGSARRTSHTKNE